MDSGDKRGVGNRPHPESHSSETELALIREIVTRLELGLLGEDGNGGKVGAHGQEIEELQRWRSRMNGALGVVLVLWSATVAVAAALIGHKN